MAGTSTSIDTMEDPTAEQATEAASEEELTKAQRSLAQFFGYRQGPNPRPGARVRIKRKGGTVIGHDTTGNVFVLMDGGGRRVRRRSEVAPDGSPRLCLAEFLRLCSMQAVDLGDPICLVQLANHFKGVNGIQYANRTAHLWSVRGLCLAGLLGDETSKLAEWLNKEIQAERDPEGFPPLMDGAEVEACNPGPEGSRSTPDRTAKVGSAAAGALKAGQASIDLAESDTPQLVDFEGLERHLAVDIANDQQVVILGRAVANPNNGFVDVIDLDSLGSYTLHTSGLNLSDDAMDWGWFWDVLTQSAVKRPTGTAAGWLASSLIGPEGTDVDIEARRRVGLFGALISVRHAVFEKSETTGKRLLRRAKELHRTLGKAERTKIAAIAPELVAPQVNTKVRLGSIEALAPHMRAAVEAMLQELPPPEPKVLEGPTSFSQLAPAGRVEPDEFSSASPIPASVPIAHKKVSFARPAQPLRFNITDHLLLAMEWQLVEEPASFDSAVAVALNWLEQRMGTSLPKHWREGAHEIELSGVALQIESTRKLFAFRLEHPDIEFPTRWWRVEVTVLVGRSGSGGMVGLRMQVRDLVDLPPPEKTVPALIRNWAAKPGLMIAGARAGHITKVRTGDQFDRLNRIIRKRDRASPVWVVAADGVRLKVQGSLGGLARVLVVDPALKEYAAQHGALDANVVHVFAPKTSRPVVISTSEPGWQNRLRLLTLETLQNPSTPSFRDVRDAIHAYRVPDRITTTAAALPPSAEIGSTSIDSAEVPQTLTENVIRAAPEAEEEAVDLQASQAESSVTIGEPSADEGEAESEPSLEDIQTLVRRETREYEELLELAETERDEVKQELWEAQSLIASLQWRIQSLETGTKVQRGGPAIPADLSELPGWAQSIAPQVIIADKALRAAAKTEHNEVPKIIASLQALRDLYWNAKFGDEDYREEANDQWRSFLMQNRMTFSPVGKAAETSRYEDEYKAVVDGVTYTAKMHISGNSTHDPLRCLRIYVVEDRVNERIVVTHLPTHLTNSLT